MPSISSRRPVYILKAQEGWADQCVSSWESCEEILPCIYSLHLRTEAAPTSPRNRDRDRDRERERPRRESPGLEVRFHR